MSRAAVRAAAAAASGALIAACFLRFELFPLAWGAFVPLLWALDGAASRREAACLGYLAGLTTNLPAFYWLVYTITAFGGFSYPVALCLYLCLTALTASQFVLLALALRRTGPGPLGVAAPLIWVTLEFWFPSLFPWRLAHCQFHAPVLLQVGDLTGPYGLSFVMVWVAAGAAALARRPRRVAPLAAAVASALAVVAYGMWRLPQVDQAMRDAPSFRIALIQGNVGIREKGDIRYFDVNIDTYRELSEPLQDSVDVLVWPETVLQHWVAADSTRLDGKENPFPALRTNLIFGGLAYRPIGPHEAEEFNSAFLLAPEGVVRGRYDKRILMPFGEYIPLGSVVPAIYALSPQTGHFTAGEAIGVFDISGRGRIGQLICYEDLVADMPRHSAQAGAEALLNILNDAWYGDTAAPYQHQALALWRSVENRRYLLRGSNTGVTSIIDAAGRIVAQGHLFTAEAVTGTVHRMRGTTLYTQVGDAFAWLVTVAAALSLWRARRPV